MDDEELEVIDSRRGLGQVSSHSLSPATIPQSYEEIYKISLRNRQRNKDKKRNREGQVDPSSGDTFGDGDSFPIASFGGSHTDGRLGCSALHSCF